MDVEKFLTEHKQAYWRKDKLLGLDVLVDPSLPDGVFGLRDNNTGETKYMVVVEADDA